MRILVTGSGGMIGPVAVAALHRSADVWTTEIRDTGAQQHVVADLTDAEETHDLVAEVGPDAVLHLAGAAGSSLPILMQSNVLTTVNIMQAVGPDVRIIVAGSAAEYGTSEADLIAENAPLEPVSPYGWAKVCQTESARAVAARRNLRLSVARPFNIVGPDLPPATAFGNIRKQITAAQPGTSLTLTSGRLDITRDLVPIGFAADVLAAITLDEDASGTYNIATGRGQMLSDVVTAMAELHGVDITFAIDPDLAALPAADRIVGDPARVADRYGLTSDPTPADLAQVILGVSGETAAGNA